MPSRPHPCPPEPRAGPEPAGAGAATEVAPLVRPACDGDADGLIALIGACFADYPGCVLDVDGEMPHLRAIATSFARRRGRAWVAEYEGRVVGVVGVRPAEKPRTMELMTLYVAHAVRRQGLGARLVEIAEAEARRRGALWVELWSDTRFTDAHRLYERLGYRRLPETRELFDLSDTVEFQFVKALGGGVGDDRGSGRNGGRKNRGCLARDRPPGAGAGPS